MTEKRGWRKEYAQGNPKDFHYRCAPWTIALCFFDGCSMMYVLTKDGDTKATAYKDELADAMRVAKDAECAS